MDAPHFIEEHVWMSAFNEATLKIFMPINLLQLLTFGNVIYFL